MDLLKQYTNRIPNPTDQSIVTARKVRAFEFRRFVSKQRNLFNLHWCRRVLYNPIHSPFRRCLVESFCCVLFHPLHCFQLRQREDVTRSSSIDLSSSSCPNACLVSFLRVFLFSFFSFFVVAVFLSCLCLFAVSCCLVFFVFCFCRFSFVCSQVWYRAYPSSPLPLPNKPNLTSP